MRLWAAIGTVSALLERRVWTVTSRSRIHPNMYILLISPPGGGKSVALDGVKEIWDEVEGLKVAPFDVSHASLLDALEAVPKQMVLSPTKMVDYHSMAINASEFSVLLPDYDDKIISILNLLYDCPPKYEQTRRTGNRKMSIPNPSVTLLAGAQPGYLASKFPEEAWTMGFASRIIMIYSAQKCRPDLFGQTPVNQTRKDWLVDTANEIMNLRGEVFWDDDAKALLERWYKLDMEPIPKHTKLQHYAARRILNMIKLMIISAVSRSRELQITRADFERAKHWLLEAEALMPDIFRDMAHRSDNDILQELHMFAMRRYVQGGKQPVPESVLVQFMQTKVTAEKMRHILYVAEAGSMLEKLDVPGGNLYIPKPRTEFQLEAGL